MTVFRAMSAGHALAGETLVNDLKQARLAYWQAFYWGGACLHCMPK